MNFEKPIEEMTDKELLRHINHFSMESAQVSMGELNRRKMDELKKSNEILSDSTDRYSKILILLTALLVVIAIYQLLVAIVQPQKGFESFAWLVLALVAIFGVAKVLEKGFFKGKGKK